MMMCMFLKPSHTLKPFNYIAAAAISSSSGAKHSIHMICCGKENPQDKDPKDFYIRTLAAVLGNEEAAKKAYISDIGGYCGFSAANLTPEQAGQISTYKRTKHLLLDYDSTMVHVGSISTTPNDEAVSILNSLCNDTRNCVFIVSGKERKTLTEWFSSCEKLGLAAEHGYFVRHWAFIASASSGW